jgi:cation:H+ antiporter
MLDVFFIVAGLIGLVWSSDKFVDGAAAIANLAGLSPLLIGLTIVSLGTSAPEIVVSVIASLSGSGELAVGNALGSNITNTGLVLGVTLIIKTMSVEASTTRRELPQMLGATLLAGALMIDGNLSVLDGLVLISALIIFLFLLSKRDSDQASVLQEPAATAAGAAWLKFLGGLTLLVISSRVLVMGAVNIATSLGVSELIVGLTIVAIGTSLPELAASVMSAMKGHADIALGAIIGSNIFNLLIVLPVPGLLGPLSLDSAVFNRDWLFTLSLAVLLMLFAWQAQRKAMRHSTGAGELGRFAGVVLLGTYISYLTILLLASDLAR